MATENDTTANPRIPLSRERLLRAAIALADADGMESLSMRRLAQELGVKAMSLYNHVADRNEIVDGIVDLVFAEIEVPADQADWKAAMRVRGTSAHQALQRHPWASSLM
ncbi:MAG TPA: TetR family transcriptional regulator, partial [Propionibacteriaceae bacterium]